MKVAPFSEKVDSQPGEISAFSRFRGGLVLKPSRPVIAVMVLVSALVIGTAAPQGYAENAEPPTVPVSSEIETGADGQTSTWAYRFLDPEGEPLPFDEEGLLDFLNTAKVVSIEDIPRGITEPKKLLLERDGVRSHAVFRDVNILRRKGPPALPESALYFKDHYAYEVAAYHLSRELGINRVPPAVLRKVDGDRGSVQVWMEEVIMNSDRRRLKLMPPNAGRWDQQEQIKYLFDAIIGNIDRNLGNLLIDRAWTSWFIDHTRCFIFVKVPPKPEIVTSCDRSVWERMQGIDPKDLKKAMKPYLGSGERSHLVGRFEYMVDHVRRLIEEKGEEEVLFDLLPADPPVDAWDKS